MKKGLFSIMLFFCLSTYAQEDIVLPVFRDVNFYSDLRDNVQLKVYKDGDIYLSGRKVETTKLYGALFTQFYDKAKYGELSLPLAFIELYVDKEAPFGYVSEIMLELRKLGLLKIHFSCESETKRYLADSIVTGFFHRLNVIDGSISILNAVEDTLSEEIKKSKFSVAGEVDTQTKFPALPPPPPSMGINVSKLKRGELGIPVVVIHVGNQGFEIENEIYIKTEISSKIYELYFNGPTVFVISPTHDCKYEDWMYAFVSIQLAAMEAREFVSQEENGVSYNKLSWEKQEQIRSRCPIMVVFDE